MKSIKSWRRTITVIILALAIILGFFTLYKNSDLMQRALIERFASLIDISEPAANTYIDSAGLYEVSVPEGWQLRFDPPCCEGSEPDWSQSSRPVRLYPENTFHEDIYISIYPASINSGESEAASIDQVWQDRNVDQFNSYERLTVNGFPALYNYLDYIGPDGIEAYTKHSYYVQLKDRVIELRFFESYKHDWNPGSEYDASKYKDDFEYIISSITVPKN